MKCSVCTLKENMSPTEWLVDVAANLNTFGRTEVLGNGLDNHHQNERIMHA